jgi:hypothetical protein
VFSEYTRGITDGYGDYWKKRGQELFIIRTGFITSIWAASGSFAAWLRHGNSTYLLNMTSFPFLAGSTKSRAFAYKAGYETSSSQSDRFATVGCFQGLYQFFRPGKNGIIPFSRKQAAEKKAPVPIVSGYTYISPINRNSEKWYEQIQVDAVAKNTLSIC